MLDTCLRILLLLYFVFINSSLWHSLSAIYWQIRQAFYVVSFMPLVHEETEYREENGLIVIEARDHSLRFHLVFSRQRQPLSHRYSGLITTRFFSFSFFGNRPICVLKCATNLVVTKSSLSVLHPLHFCSYAEMKELSYLLHLWKGME